MWRPVTVPSSLFTVAQVIWFASVAAFASHVMVGGYHLPMYFPRLRMLLWAPSPKKYSWLTLMQAACPSGCEAHMVVSPARSKVSRTSVKKVHLTMPASIIYHNLNLERDPIVNSGRRCHPCYGVLGPKDARQSTIHPTRQTGYRHDAHKQ